MGSIPVAQPTPRRTWHFSRHVVPLALLMLGVVAVIGVALAVAWPTPEPGTTISAGSVGNYEPNSVTHLEDSHFFLVRLADGSFLALHDLATGHLNDPIEWRPNFTFDGETGWFRSPFHGETYDREGSLVAGPAARGMDRYPLKIAEGRIIVDTAIAYCGDGLPSDIAGGRDQCELGLVYPVGAPE